MTPLEATDIERLRELLAKACTENVAIRVPSAGGLVHVEATMPIGPNTQW
jgi:hypothetical protein